MKRLYLPILALAFSVLSGCQDETDTKLSGYFKDDVRNRVIAYEAARKLSPDEVRIVFDRAPKTDGKTTVVVIYEPDSVSPGHELSAAPDLPAAMRLIGGAEFKGWSHRVRINARGVETYG